MLKKDKTLSWIIYCIKIASILCINGDNKHVNIAMEQTTHASSANGTESNTAVNGNFDVDNCFKSNTDAAVNEWLLVSFSKKYFIRSIRILNSDNNFSMRHLALLTTVFDSLDFDQYTLCGFVEILIPIKQSATIDCLKGPQYAKSVAVEKRLHYGSLSICEIEIWTMRDLDRNKVDFTGKAGYRLIAINDGQSSSGRTVNCGETRKVFPSWWMINLESESEIYAVSIVSRANFVARLNFVKILVSSNNTDPPWIPEKLCNKIETASSYITRRCKKSTIGQYVALYKYVELASNILSICEVEVFGSSSQDTISVYWVINTVNSTSQHYTTHDNRICSLKTSHTIGIAKFKTKSIIVELKGVSLLESCFNEAAKTYTSSQNNVEECRLLNTTDGYYSEIDMMDSCVFQCYCQPNICFHIHLITFQSKLQSLNRDFFVIVNV
ncbi:unnamed protein product [Dimorphilus gyrociliatus]|uniref:Uncharacterized protein n=1 Tax=Dimorphilus gyrociliatus TaxID=2664684 RepID=A0A7I8WE74_9ANNE|nr:unnamed protein product [Dimorphilus gyrociliatus]